MRRKLGLVEMEGTRLLFFTRDSVTLSGYSKMRNVPSDADTISENGVYKLAVCPKNEKYLWDTSSQNGGK